MNSLGAISAKLAFATEPEDQVRLLSVHLALLDPDEREATARMLAEPPHARRIRLSALRNLAREQIGEELYALSQDFVGDASETIALVWQPSRQHNRPPTTQDIWQGLAEHGPSKLLPAARDWLDASDVEGRHVLIRVLTGSFRPPAPRHVLEKAFEIGNVRYRPEKEAHAPVKGRQSDMFRTDVAPQGGSITAVLLYVHRAPRRNEPVMCTFGVWNEGALVPVGKASAEKLTTTIARHVQEHTIRRFGPTSHVAHTDQIAMLLEVSFEGVSPSRRHKAGLTLQAPVIQAIHPSHALDDVASIDDLTRRLPQFNSRG